MDVVYHSIRYVQGVTQVTTTAENAAELGMGVCQDYAHIFLALLRKEHVPCRYVVGMMSGEGASHAWVEIFDGENGLALILRITARWMIVIFVSLMEETQRIVP